MGAAGLVVAVIASVAALWPPGAGEDLVIYSAMGPGGPMIAAFEAEAGLRVSYINMAGGPLQARIYAEGRHARWTLAWFVGDAAMAALDAAGLLAHPALTAADVPAWTARTRAVLPADGAYAPTGLTLAGVFVTSRGLAPANWKELETIPGGVGMVSPVMSGTAYPVLTSMMQAVGGSEPGRALLRQLDAKGLVVAATNPLLIGQLRRGEIGVALLPSQAAYALAARETGFDVTVPRPAGLVPAVIGISASASPTLQDKARRFIRFLLTPAGQMLIRRSTAEGFAWPPIEGVPPPPGLPKLEGLDLVHPDPVEWGARQGAEIGWFRREIAP